MSDRRYAFVLLASAALVASVLACNPPNSTSAPQPPPATVTPYVPATASSQETQPPPATIPPQAASPEATSPSETPAATDTPQPTNTPRPAATAKPTQPVSAGPLDFDPPTWIHSWEPLADGGVKAVIRIIIVGGAPPFTISHGPSVVGQTMQREYLIEFIRHGCSGIPQSITVESADGQSVKKDYWIGADQQPWCN